jgi:hypothetical protein
VIIVEMWAKGRESSVDVSLDVAALIGAITWPAAVIIVLFIYRNAIRRLLGSLRLTSLGIPNILSAAFEASGPNPNENQILRESLQQHLIVEEIIDRVAGQISQLLQDKTPLDYVVVDLGRDDG